MSENPQISIITLGCSKNIVDSEYLGKQLQLNGFNVIHEAESYTDIVIVNTCGFINDAKQESINTILDYNEAKKQGKIDKLFVMGCLSQRYKEELQQEIKEVDDFFGVEQQSEILQSLKSQFKEDKSHERLLYTSKPSAYLKIAEGCNRKCSFCSIPFIRGNYKSKSIEQLKSESAYLEKEGVRELNLIAQDLSFYGYDLYKKYALPELLKQLASEYSFDWLRLLYFYPHNFPEEILDVMNDHENICNYLDIPFQHINDKMLKYMHRGIDKDNTYRLIELIKSKIPNITLRTTLLVGHPGEEQNEFNELLEFVKEIEFDRLGVFTYSEEEGTFSAQNFKDDIPDHIKQERSDEIMKTQQQISLRKNESKIGKAFNILIEREDKDHYFGRSEADAPEVDNEIIIPKNGSTIDLGTFQKAEIISAYDYDLVGKIK